MFRRLDPFGNANVGVFVRVTDDHLWIPPGLTKQNRQDLEEAFELEATEVTIGGSNLIGSLVAANGTGAIVADIASAKELKIFEDAGLRVAQVTGSRLNAAGNNILCNDHGAIVHPELSKKTVALVEETLGVPAVHGSIADVPTVGTAAAANNKGAITHPLATEDELSFIKKALGVTARIGTVNHGHGLVGAGLSANDSGVATGSRTTGIELGRIEDALGFLE